MTVQTSRSPGAATRFVAATAHPAAAPRQAWLMVALLFLFMVINFADKAVVGIAAVPIMDELGLGPRAFGLLGSSFFLLFAVSAIVTGFIVNRVETRWALLVMGLVWALTQFPMLGNAGFATIVAARIALGAGEGPAYPVALHSAYKWFPNEQRTVPTAIVAQGAGIGIMVALPLLNWVIVRYSWHWAFGVLGIAGLVWSAAWFVLGREGPLDGRSRRRSGKSMDAAAQRIAYHGCCSARRSWRAGRQFRRLLGPCRTRSRGRARFSSRGSAFRKARSACWARCRPASPSSPSLPAGWYSQRLLARGVSSRVARGILGGGCVALGGAALTLMPFVPGKRPRSRWRRSASLCPR